MAELLVVVEHGEGLAGVGAVRAGERLLARVEPHVVLEGGLRLEPLVAVGALKLSLPVDGAVLGQLLLGPEGLAADRAGEPVREVDGVDVAALIG